MKKMCLNFMEVHFGLSSLTQEKTQLYLYSSKSAENCEISTLSFTNTRQLKIDETSNPVHIENSSHCIY